MGEFVNTILVGGSSLPSGHEALKIIAAIDGPMRSTRKQKVQPLLTPERVVRTKQTSCRLG